MENKYSQIFDSTCLGWGEDKRFNLMFLAAKQNYFNDILRARGYVFLRDIYEDLGFPVTRESLVVGWVYAFENPIGDNFIDFGIAANGDGPDIRLNFNVGGDITDRFVEES